MINKRADSLPRSSVRPKAFRTKCDGKTCLFSVNSVTVLFRPNGALSAKIMSFGGCFGGQITSFGSFRCTGRYAVPAETRSSLSVSYVHYWHGLPLLAHDSITSGRGPCLRMYGMRPSEHVHPLESTARVDFSATAERCAFTVRESLSVSVGACSDERAERGGTFPPARRQRK